MHSTFRIVAMENSQEKKRFERVSLFMGSGFACMTGLKREEGGGGGGEKREKGRECLL